jgi:predicted dehydrogenase
VAKVNRELAGEDAAVVLLKGTGGLTAVLDGNISAPGHGPLPTDRVEIMGTRGTLVFDRDRLTMAGSNDPPVVFDLAKNYQICFTSAVREFVRGLREDKPFAMDRMDNLETLKLMESCYVAAGVKI